MVGGFEDDAASWISIVHDEVPWNTPGGDYDATELGSFSTTIADATHMEYTVAVTDAVKHWVDKPQRELRGHPGPGRIPGRLHRLFRLKGQRSIRAVYQC